MFSEQREIFARQIFPPVGIAMGIYIVAAVLLKFFDQRCNRFDPVTVFVIPGVEKLLENPLRPAIIGRIGSAYLAAPVVIEAEFTELFSVPGNIFFNGDGRVLTGLNGILFGRE